MAQIVALARESVAGRVGLLAIRKFDLVIGKELWRFLIVELAIRNPSRTMKREWSKGEIPGLPAAFAVTAHLRIASFPKRQFTTNVYRLQ
jgi:hypothetical protein